MNTTNDIQVCVDDLAGHLTEPVLETLKAAGMGQVSVSTELETWHTLKKILETELRWQHPIQFPPLVSLRSFMEDVARRAAVLLARKLAPQAEAARSREATEPGGYSLTTSGGGPWQRQLLAFRL